MSARCRGCVGYRERVGYPSCKTQKLCKLVDVTLMSRHRTRTLDELKSTHELNSLGQSRAGAYVGQLAAVPTEAPAFIETLNEIHRRIFIEGEPCSAGRFRTPTEPAYFGGEGNHRREGVPSNEIERALVRLHGTLSTPSEVTGRDQICICLARFFERYFMIHPYVDGNGRVARFVAELYARSTGRWRWDQRGLTRCQRRSYVKALEYAHMHTKENHDPNYNRGRSALEPLAGWIGRRLVDVDHDWDLLDRDERA